MPGKNRLPHSHGSSPGTFGRRAFVTGATAALLGLPVATSRAFAANPTGARLHGLSIFGALKYPADFRHFDYVRPDAPKGGRFHYAPPSWFWNQNTQTFNTLNAFVLRGDSPPRMELCFDSLMVSALDEPDALYCHLAAFVEVSGDRNTYRFGLRQDARFHDGTPVTADDVAFTLTTLKSDGHPSLAEPLRQMTSATAIDPSSVEIAFSGRQSAYAILAAAGMPILSKAYYTENPFDSSSLAVPLSSGPYRPGRLEGGRFIEYERVADYWGADLPTARGLNNFDVIRIDFFAEREAGFEAFKKGDIHFREEFTSKTWATEYNFPAFKDGKVVKRTFPDEKRPSFQAWALNQRRARFADIRVRQAINLCFDFEWTNAKIFFNAYSRSQSLFETSDFKAEGAPTPAEKAVLDTLPDVPDAAYGEAVLQPASDGSGRDRALLKKASDLLQAAGYRPDGRVLVRDGERLTLEILIEASIFERLLSSFVENLRRIGIDATVRLVDPAQYRARLNDFDFDMMGVAYSLNATPAAEDMAQFFASASADQKGSNNFPGARVAAYDALIERMRGVRSRDELVTILRVLDRVERARLDWIPNWYAANHRAAYWDMFGFVEPKPDYGWPVESLWWHDAEKAKTIGRT